MNRIDLESWLDRHPGSVHESAHDLIDRCEADVSHHAEVIAWKQALKVATSRLRRFEGQFGLPASETFVTHEVCHDVARELKQNEPQLERVDENEWLSRASLDSIDPQARIVVREWVRELAAKEEHRVWREIVAFTHHVARALIAKEHMTAKLDWDLDRSYPRLASRVTKMLLREYAIHLRESRRGMTPRSELH